MMITGYRGFSVICLCVLLATPLFGEVFAQVEEGEELVASSTAPVVAAEQVTDTLWYKSEQISGNINLGDFVVGPGRVELSVNPGETIIQEVLVTNRISDQRTFRLEVEDISGSKDGSSAVSLSGEQRGPYSIRDYISFPEDTFVLKLGERARIPVTISVPADAEPGGFYGSVLVSTVQDSGSTNSAAPRSPVVARVGSLIFLTVNGETEIAGQTVEIQTLNKQRWYNSGPVQFNILYENTGSVHLNPYGELEISNMFGEQVGFVEIEPWFVLPTSLRVKEVEWTREFLLGRYTAVARINRGYDDIVDEVTVTFWVLPWKLVGGVFLVLFVVIFCLRAFFRTFEFKRR